MNTSPSKVSILVSSCDKYQEAWFPFFALLSKYWPNCPYPKYLLTETMSFSGDMVETINSEKHSWSSRLLDALNCLESEYVLFMLDDFFLMKPVKTEVLDQYVGYMEKDKDLSVIYLKSIANQHRQSEKYNGLIEMEKGKKYYVNFQVALWRRSAFIDALLPNLSPWDIEENAKWERGEGNFLCVSGGSYSDCSNDIIPYLWAQETGFGICKSMWLWNNKSFFKREGIQCKCNSLPTMSKYTYLKNKYVRMIQDKVFGFITKNREQK